MLDTFITSDKISTPETSKKSKKKKSFLNKLKGHHENFKVAVSPKRLNSPKPLTRLSLNKAVSLEKPMKVKAFKKQKSRIKKKKKKEIKQIIQSPEPLEAPNLNESLPFDLNSNISDHEEPQSFDVDSPIVLEAEDGGSATETEFKSRMILSSPKRKKKPRKSLPTMKMNETLNSTFEEALISPERVKPSTDVVNSSENEKEEEGNEEEEEEELKGGERLIEPKTGKSATPHRRRSKRVKWEPLKYWKGERVRYDSNLIEKIRIKGAFKTLHCSSPVQSLSLTKFNERKKKFQLPSNLEDELKRIERGGKIKYFDTESSKFKSIDFKVPKGKRKPAGWKKHGIRTFENFEETVAAFPPLSLNRKEVEKSSIYILTDFSYKNITVGKFKITKRGLKLMEDSGEAETIFKIIKCQPNSLVLRLQEGDHIVDEGVEITVPENTVYGFENMSKTIEAIISYRVIQKDDEDEDEAEIVEIEDDEEE